MPSTYGGGGACSWRKARIIVKEKGLPLFLSPLPSHRRGQGARLGAVACVIAPSESSRSIPLARLALSRSHTFPLFSPWRTSAVDCVKRRQQQRHTYTRRYSHARIMTSVRKVWIRSGIISAVARGPPPIRHSVAHTRAAASDECVYARMCRFRSFVLTRRLHARMKSLHCVSQFFAIPIGW